MTTFTDKELIKEIKERISSLDVRDNIERRAYEIALASLEAEPVSQTYNLPELIEGMEVSIDVSTCDADLGNRYFGTVMALSRQLTGCRYRNRRRRRNDGCKREGFAGDAFSGCPAR